TQERALAGAVRPDHRQPLAARNLGVDAVDDELAAERDRDSAEPQGRHVKLRLVRSTTAKKGAPKNAVTTPIGSSAGDMIVRARTSVSTRKPAPTSSDSGTTAR